MRTTLAVAALAGFLILEGGRFVPLDGFFRVIQASTAVEAGLDAGAIGYQPPSSPAVRTAAGQNAPLR